MQLALLSALLLSPSAPPAAVGCIDLPAIQRAGETEVEISVSIVRLELHDFVEAQQDGCQKTRWLLIYDGGPALMELVDLRMNSTDGVPHARITGRFEIAHYPPSLGGGAHLYFRLATVNRTWIEPSANDGGSRLDGDNGY